MPNIIRIKNLELETNIEGVIIPVDKNSYSANAKQINVLDLKNWILSGFTGGTGGSGGTSGTSGFDGVDGTSGVSPCDPILSNTITINIIAGTTTTTTPPPTTTTTTTPPITTTTTTTPEPTTTTTTTPEPTTTTTTTSVGIFELDAQYGISIIGLSASTASVPVFTFPVSGSPSSTQLMISSYSSPTTFDIKISGQTVGIGDKTILLKVNNVTIDCYVITSGVTHFETIQLISSGSIAITDDILIIINNTSTCPTTTTTTTTPTYYNYNATLYGFCAYHTCIADITIQITDPSLLTTGKYYSDTTSGGIYRINSSGGSSGTYTTCYVAGGNFICSSVLCS